MAITVDDVERAIRGGAPLRFFGKTFVRKLRARDRERFERAKSDGFLVVPLAADEALANAWRAFCEIACTPLVIVSLRARHATLCVDVSPTSEWFNDVAAVRLRALFARVGGDEDEDWLVSPTRAEHLQVPLEGCEEVAKAAHLVASAHREASRVAQARLRRARRGFH